MKVAGSQHSRVVYCRTPSMGLERPQRWLLVELSERPPINGAPECDWG